MFFVLLLTLASGWFLSSKVTERLWAGPRWTSYLGNAALAFLFGPGLASILYFALVIAHIATPGAIYGGLAALCGGSIAWWVLNRRGPRGPGTSPPFSLAGGLLPRPAGAPAVLSL